MRKIYWVKLSDTDVEASGNQIKIEGELPSNLEVSVVDEKNDPIHRYLDVKKGEHKILISMNFQWAVNEYDETSTDKVEYIMKKNDDCWKINKDERSIEVKKEPEFKQAWKKMHRKLLEKKFKEKIEKKQGILTTDMKYNILPDGGGNYKVKIYEGDSSEDKEFSWEKVKIEANYYPIKKISSDSDEFISIKWPEKEKKFQLTTSWFIFFVALTVVLVLIIVFWKKIWKWIKGERKQEKKVKEQLDIF